ncbi:uncharacterized protein LOC122511350 [Leptopilina heterotoma]|uniref:uncharacterized protein LOC122511350 n=1 Tax=Leptopilina heterotoma TaxID=63436 RepID=UPI001CAA2168|nr:uncharacterized protein LOC122511350 [Leptopilina heterotoma]
MDPLKLRFLTERYKKESRFITLIGEFKPSIRSKPVTGKFYAKHDALLIENVPEDFIKFIIKKKNATPKDFHSYPPPSINMESAP